MQQAIVRVRHTTVQGMRLPEMDAPPPTTTSKIPQSVMGGKVIKRGANTTLYFIECEKWEINDSGKVWETGSN